MAELLDIVPTALSAHNNIILLSLTQRDLAHLAMLLYITTRNYIFKRSLYNKLGNFQTSRK